MRTLIAIALACCVGLAGAASERPNEDKAGTNPSAKTNQQNQGRVLDTSALEKAIRESIKDASEKEPPHEGDHLKNEGELVEYTRQLAVSTEGLAEFTLWLVIVGGITAALLLYQSILTCRVAELAREEFAATHRPRVLVRRCIPIYTEHKKLECIRYTVHNIGDTECTINESRAALWFSPQGKPFPPDSAYGEPESQALILRPGESKSMLSRPPDSIRDKIGYWNINKRELRLHFIGFLNYVDHAKVIRQTGFLRTYDWKTDGFEASESRDYEYAD